MTMRRLVVPLLAVGIAALALAGAAAADHPGEGGAPFGATLTGAAECMPAGVCGVGHPTGSGTILLRLNPGQEEICFDMTTAGIGPARASHIHPGEAGQVGGVLVPLTGAFTDQASSCVFAPREVILAIMKNPENYYVNVHTAAFPGGAIRGQLGHVAPGQAKRG